MKTALELEIEIIIKNVVFVASNEIIRNGAVFKPDMGKIISGKAREIIELVKEFGETVPARIETDKGRAVSSETYSEPCWRNGTRPFWEPVDAFIIKGGNSPLQDNTLL
jgi:hypothetical protein